jgi:hypothetical protein
VATTVNVAVCPSQTVWFEGFVVIVGGVTPRVRVAAALVVVPTPFVTLQRNRSLLYAAVTGGVVYVAPVAPEMLLQAPALYLCHWYVKGQALVAITVNVAVCPSQTV